MIDQFPQWRIFARSRSGALKATHTGIAKAWRGLISHQDAGACIAPHLRRKPVQKSALQFPRVLWIESCGKNSVTITS